MTVGEMVSGMKVVCACIVILYRRSTTTHSAKADEFTISSETNWRRFIHRASFLFVRAWSIANDIERRQDTKTTFVLAPTHKQCATHTSSHKSRGGHDREATSSIFLVVIVTTATPSSLGHHYYQYCQCCCS